ncbi:MAG TPA: MBL fold metallo-hydrolase [bacterium]|nr:MBL fold metallo-hydrolase [bacterium]
MILQQYYLRCLAHASYLVGDEERREAAVVDPQRDVDQYLEDARAAGLEIRHVILTHFHADFVAGHLELRDRSGATIYLGRRAQAEYAFTPLGNGEAIDLGRVRLEALETPGHSPESVSLLVYNLAKDNRRPHAVLTGDTLFIGDVGRPDLRAALGWSAEDLAGMLYDSLREKLLTLPDDTLVYPAHGAGSMCGKNLSTDTVSTIGIQRRYNYALQPMSREEFVGIVMADQPDAPPYFTFDAALNTQERSTLDATLARVMIPLTVEDLLRLRNAGAQILDTRDPAQFAGAHVVDSINISLRGEYASWAGTILERDRPIVIVSEAGRETEAAMRLGRIGFDHIAGYLAGGMEALDGRPLLIGRTERITAPALVEVLAGPAPPVVLDVRTPAEWKQERIAGTLHIPLNHLRERLGEVPPGRKIVVHCASGYRSSIAASLLQLHRAADIADLVGGIAAWKASHLPTITAAPA